MSSQLLKKGFIARGGQIIDATLVPAPKQHNSGDDKDLIAQGAMPVDWKPAKRRQKDLDATWTSKHGKSYFGYKLSINVDKKYKLIRQIETDTASTHDSQHFEKVIDAGNTSRDVYADRGYPSAEREAWLKEKGFRNQIQRKGKRNTRRFPSASSDATTASPKPAPGLWKVDPDDRPGAGHLCDDDDGGQLQSEAVGVFQEGRNRGLLTPMVGRTAGARGDSK